MKEQAEYGNHPAKIEYAQVRLRGNTTPRFARVFRFYRDTESSLPRVTGQLLHHDLRPHCQELKGLKKRRVKLYRQLPLSFSIPTDVPPI